MATTGWYGPRWYVTSGTNTDLALIAAQHAVALALLETRLAAVETESSDPEPVVDGGTP